MEKHDIDIYSQCLNRWMKIKVYGHYGKPYLFFPCQNSMSNDMENFGMIDTLSDYIEQGRMKVFTVDSIDLETFSDLNGDKSHRSYMQEQYYYFVINEVLPAIKADCQSDVKPILSGFSMGANHATIYFLRRPDLFDGMMVFSGCYDHDMFFGNWCDDRLYNNSPLRFMANMPSDHPNISLYNQKQIIFVVGQGNWEEEGVRTLHIMQDIFYQKGINAWFEYWGYDVAHDWPWWKKQIRYILDKVL